MLFARSLLNHTARASRLQRLKVIWSNFICSWTNFRVKCINISKHDTTWLRILVQFQIISVFSYVFFLLVKLENEINLNSLLQRCLLKKTPQQCCLCRYSSLFLPLHVTSMCFVFKVIWVEKKKHLNVHHALNSLAQSDFERIINFVSGTFCFGTERFMQIHTDFLGGEIYCSCIYFSKS